MLVAILFALVSSLVFDAFAKNKANGETLMHGSVIVAALVCRLLRRCGDCIHAHNHVIGDDHVDATSLVFPKLMHCQHLKPYMGIVAFVLWTVCACHSSLAWIISHLVIRKWSARKVGE
jgi:hypothetical protein